MIEKCVLKNICYDFRVGAVCFIYVFVFARLVSNTITISDNVLTTGRQCLPLVEKDMIALPEQPSLTLLSWSSCCTILCFLCLVDHYFCSFLFYCFFVIVLLVLLRFPASDYPSVSSKWSYSDRSTQSRYI